LFVDDGGIIDDKCVSTVVVVFIAAMVYRTFIMIEFHDDGRFERYRRSGGIRSR
jgi:hypothetical protein